MSQSEEGGGSVGPWYGTALKRVYFISPYKIYEDCYHNRWSYSYLYFYRGHQNQQQMTVPCSRFKEPLFYPWKNKNNLKNAISVMSF